MKDDSRDMTECSECSLPVDLCICKDFDPKFTKVEGVGKDAPITTNERGGGQSYIPFRFDLLDGKALSGLARVLAEGAEKYAPNNWRLIPLQDHLNHAMMHIFAYLAEDTQDEHLEHALTRLMFAVAQEKDGETYKAREIVKKVE